MFTRDDTGEVAIIRMAHGKVSALDTELCTALADEIRAVSSGAPRALVLTGTGSSFSAGVDLFRVLNGGAEYLQQFLPAMESLFHALLSFPKPTVAAINGHAIAGGCIMACACDHRIMADGPGRIGVPELLVGVPFPTLPFEIVGARVQPTALRSLVYAGRTELPAEAIGLGLIDEIAPADALMSRALAVADRLSQVPAKTFALTKQAFNTPVLARVRASATLNADVMDAWADSAVQARVRAYLEKAVKRT
jgi:enoyl-CoA hydratase